MTRAFPGFHPGVLIATPLRGWGLVVGWRWEELGVRGVLVPRISSGAVGCYAPTGLGIGGWLEVGGVGGAGAVDSPDFIRGC